MGMINNTKNSVILNRKPIRLDDDDLFGESLYLSSNREDNYVWSVMGQCWLPK